MLPKAHGGEVPVDIGGAYVVIPDDGALRHGWPSEFAGEFQRKTALGSATSAS